MKVLALTNMYPSAAEPWFGCFVKDQLDAVRDAGVDVEVFAFDGRRHKTEYGRAATALRRRVSANGFDIVHAHYGLSGAVALTQRRVPVVTTIWGTDAGYVAWQGRVSWLVARMTRPIFVSRHNAHALGLPSATVIPSGIDTTFFAPMARAEARAKLGLGDGRYVLFPGSRAVRRKRADLFDAACAELGKDGPDVETLALQGYTRDEARLVMSAVDVVLMTSDWEGSPLAVKEALSCGTRVVSVHVGDVPEVISGLPGCAIADRDPIALANALRASLSSAEVPNELRSRAMAYDQREVAKRILAEYEAVAA
jgi:glycosyltransferase involved in cell wall biosynthesis